jgi:hypothetical protein
VANHTDSGTSWLALITFCLTTALVAALALGLLFASATLAFGIAQPSPVEAQIESSPSQNTAVRSITGLVTDAQCGAKHTDSSKSVAECVRECARKGVKYALLDGDKTYLLEGMGDQLSVVAGQRATISGTIQGDIIKVGSIKPLSSTQP